MKLTEVAKVQAQVTLGSILLREQEEQVQFLHEVTGISVTAGTGAAVATVVTTLGGTFYRVNEVPFYYRDGTAFMEQAYQAVLQHPEYSGAVLQV